MSRVKLLVRSDDFNSEDLWKDLMAIFQQQEMWARIEHEEMSLVRCDDDKSSAV